MQALHWLRAARPVAHGMLAIPLLLGQAFALVITQQFHWQWFFFIQLFGVFCQVYILYLNDYADQDVDRLNTTYWLSGGSRVIPDGCLTGRQLYRASFLAVAGIVLLALLSAWFGRPWMLLLGALALFIGWNYSLPPLRSSYRGFGELHQAVSCGVLLPLTAFYLQSGSLAAFPWALLLPCSVIFYAANIVTALLDMPSDAEGGKRTYPVRNGAGKARAHALLLLVVAYVSAAAFSSPWVSFGVMVLLVAAPAFAVLIYVAGSGLLQEADVRNRPRCKRFVSLLTLSQLWLMAGWTGVFFWRGMSPL